MDEFKRACVRMGLEINVRKSKVFVIKNDESGSCEKVKVSAEESKR